MLSAPPTDPASVIWWRPGESRTQKMPAESRIAGVVVASTRIAFARQTDSPPGSGTATSASACTERRIRTSSSLTPTSAVRISAHRGTQAGGASSRLSSSRSMSESGVVAPDAGLAPSVKLATRRIAAPYTPDRPRVSPPGKANRRLRISAAKVAARPSNNPTSKKRSKDTAQLGRIKSRIVCSGFTGPLHSRR